MVHLSKLRNQYCYIYNELNSRLDLDFISFSINVLPPTPPPVSNTGDHIAISCHVSSISSVTVSKFSSALKNSTRHLSCRSILSLGLSDILVMIRLGLWV